MAICLVEHRVLALGVEEAESDEVQLAAGADLACPTPPGAELLSRTLICIDWDDTLFPSSWLAQIKDCDGKLLSLSDEQQSQLLLLAENVIKTLEAVLLCGTAVIVTNAHAGWVQSSCAMFMPAALPTVEKFRIVSARSEYEPLCADPRSWKRKAFTKEVSNFYGAQPLNSVRNIISIGDAPGDHDALLFVTKDRPNDLAKMVKFLDKPDIQQLIEQHEAAIDCLLDIVDYEQSLKLELDLDGGDSDESA